MRHFRYLALATVVAASLATVAPRAGAQIEINVGAPPACPYGYFDYAPYDCAPYGYYGPEWFSGGIFIGAGPWFHGRHDFHGYVNNHYSPQHGYHGALPRRGEHATHRGGPPAHFQGNEMRDGHGHATGGRGGPH